VPALYHFCATLNAGAFVDLRPQFAFEEQADTGLVTSVVTLPTVVDPSLRTAKSSEAYRTERMAKRDAAFEAYSALYEAGLVNENLLPNIKTPEDFEESLRVDDKASVRLVMPRLNPWILIAQAAETIKKTWHRILITVSLGSEITRVTMCSPSPIIIPQLSSFPLYWNEEIHYDIELKTLESCFYTEEDIIHAQRFTRSFYASGHNRKLEPDQNDFLLYFMPEEYHWMDHVNSGDISMLNTGIVTWHLTNERFLFERLASKQSNENDAREVIVTNIPKRKNFLHPVAADQTFKAFTKETSLPLDQCSFGNVPHRYCIFAFFIPSILHRIELLLVAEGLRSTILKPIGIENLYLVQTAITHTAAREVENYQRFEFLGDCLLKYYMSLQLVAEHPAWPEGYLTQSRSIRVSNSALEIIARRIGLDRFIIADIFNGTGWRPPHRGEILKQNRQNEDLVERPSKMLADVMESLIGAAYVDGGLYKALRCIEMFFPGQFERTPAEALIAIRNTTRSDVVHLHSLERLVGHEFGNKALLLEAITHGSFHSYQGTMIKSYEVLEFLGDAVLDYLVVRRLWSHEIPLPHHVMHGRRTAMVNSWILGFLCMEHCISEPINIIVKVEGSGEFTSERSTAQKHLWERMRYSSPAITVAQHARQSRHAVVREELMSQLQFGERYPWAVLARFGPEKFYSDLIESMIGAIYVDTLGDLERCDAFLERLGLWTILDRVLRDDVNCLHPKERLGHLAVSDRVEYIKRFHQGRWMCQIKVGGKEVGKEVEGYLSVDVEAEAATRAVSILENGLREKQILQKEATEQKVLEDDRLIDDRMEEETYDHRLQQT
jgi:dsRNA-specific ribonuclease